MDRPGRGGTARTRGSRRRPTLVVTAPGRSSARRTAEALRRVMPGAEIGRSGFHGVLRVEADGEPLAVAERLGATCGELVGRVTAVLAEAPSEPRALARAACAVALDQVGPGQSFAFRIHKRGRHGYRQTSPALEAEVGEAICEVLGERDGARARVELTEPDVLLSGEVLGPVTLVGRVRRHPSRRGPSRFVLHVDLDQFIVAVELLRRPDLRGRPVVVGDEGDLTRRGVVAGASYAARRCGVHSAMPLRRAAARCPELVCLPLDRERYQQASAAVMATLRSFPADVEVAGWDEAYLEVEVRDPERFGRDLQAVVRRRTRLWCSVGIGENKLQAKTAAGLAKPRGVARLSAAMWPVLVGPRRPELLAGVGPKTARRLGELGIRRVKDLAEAPNEALVGAFGPVAGPRLRLLARGESASRVLVLPVPARSRGHEVTFQRNLEDPAAVQGEVRRLAADLAREVAADGRTLARVVVKVRFAPFETHTHGAGVEAGRADSLERAALGALSQFVLDKPVRLVGVRAEFALRGASPG